MTGHTAKAEPAADVVMVKIDEEDLAGCGWPVPDARIAAILNALHATAPAVTGLDIYRDTPMGKGASDLQRSFSVSDAIAISKLGPDGGLTVDPPDYTIERGNHGFSDIPVDHDGIVRLVLFLVSDGALRLSFALKLVLRKLGQETSEP